ncbi:hypothetical protein FB567DRAFT_523718 [Paraphoma chrysanthemicola]|uniref:Uncharacterized protein n=1 Tax=Paraphoma chrysanthemicola TaxID=798071 RepID=A0A8K0VZ92_9PLEO|nr:hypothetical protein FB567DRAFT_523718 [Paraphoma chrysanthemicola]
MHDTTRSDNSTKDAEITDLTRERDQLQRVYDATCSDNPTKDATITDLRCERESASESLEALRTHATSKTVELEAEINELKSSNTTAKEDLAEKIKLVDRLTLARDRAIVSKDEACRHATESNVALAVAGLAAMALSRQVQLHLQETKTLQGELSAHRIAISRCLRERDDLAKDFKSASEQADRMLVAIQQHRRQRRMLRDLILSF